MAKLVQEGLHLAKCQQSRFLGCWLRQVHHHAYVRTHVHALAVYPLTLKFGHPCAALLALAWVEVGIEHGKVRAVLIEHLVSLDVGVVHLYVLCLLERYAV